MSYHVLVNSDGPMDCCTSPLIELVGDGMLSSTSYGQIDATGLNRKYKFVSCHQTASDVLHVIDKDSTARGICLENSSLHLLLHSYNFFTCDQLMSICSTHSVPFSTNNSKSSLMFKLNQHSLQPCSESCAPWSFHYIFHLLDRHRTQLGNAVDDQSITQSHEQNMAANIRNRENFVRVRREELQSHRREDQILAESNYASIPSDEMKVEIIKEWQNHFKTSSFGQKACAVCSLSELKSGLLFKWCDIEHQKLSLLRNDHLPDHLLPVDYNVAAYNRAILNMKGLKDLQNLGQILLCKQCEASLIEKNEMPDLAMANWLYYGHHRLPPDIYLAFKEASSFEKMLISRCTASRIIHRFSDKQDSPVYGQPSVSSQRYSQGNTIVLPQDSIGLNNCLPPGPETVFDTMCALFVGKEKPSPDNIMQLSPVLIRRTRLKKLISFLISSNPHYQTSDSFLGFSHTNLEALFNPEDPSDLQLPSILQDNFIMATPAINSTISAGITDCDAVDNSVCDNNTDILMENVGYTDGDFSSASYQKMKVDALNYCLNGGTYIKSQRGSDAVPDFYHPSLLTWLFPHLDPYGIGGFFEPRRRKKLSLEKQFHHLMMIDETLFEKDSSFAYVFYNILQKREVVKSSNFRINSERHVELADSLMKIQPPLLEELSRKYKENPQMEPESPEQCEILKSLDKLKLVCKDLPGSSAYKQCRRNEIRGLINRFGSPALFVTINSSDVNHPLVRLLAGDDINLEDATVGEQLDKFQRKIKVANNPAAAALFFDLMIRGFIDIILGWKIKRGGLFGSCKCYYGMVEAQGKGTLHCHMLIWLHGHLSPLDLRDRMQREPSFKSKIFDWLESIIKCELPDTSQVVYESNGPLDQPAREGRHPTLLPAPKLEDHMTWEEFQPDFNQYVSKIVVEHNWHVHNSTCWKYLKPGDKHDDAHCRMRINGSTNPQTHLDPETLSINLRRLHPRISNYNDIISFLMKCNNDIKFIGSGGAAQALVFYVTDYITKSSLATHAGLAALAYGIRKNAEKFPADDITERRAKNLVTKVINAMMSRQELSHQQIMSYIVGGGDCYRSHSFSILHWGSFDSLVRNQMKESVANGMPDNVTYLQSENHPPAKTSDHDASGVHVEDNLLLSFHNDSQHMESLPHSLFENDAELDNNPSNHCSSTNVSISTSNQCIDYTKRSFDAQFNCMCLYDYIAKVKKISKKSEAVRMGNPNHCKNIVRGQLPEDHPQYSTHLCRLKKETSVPVILGPTIPKKNLSASNYEIWAWAMLILFKPWRKPHDLKQPGETWASAHSQCSFSDEHTSLMRNMEVLSECKDSRDADMQWRCLQPELITSSASELDQFVLALRDDGQIDVSIDEASTCLEDQEHVLMSEDVCIDTTQDALFHLNMAGIPISDLPSPENVEGRATPATSADRKVIQLQAEMMQKLKTKRRPIQETRISEQPTQRRRLNADLSHSRASTFLERLQTLSASSESVYRTATSGDLNNISNLDVVEQLIIDQNMPENPEQARALRIIGKHVMEGGCNQLLMYISGVGGTGKSHVISSVKELFNRLGREQELLLSAPTGIAAVLIGGYTIHSLTFLPKSKHQKNCQDKLTKIWHKVRYLVIDEVSMISALMLSQISEQINLARQCPSESGSMFGGVSVIFTGDMGQLKPVKALSLFSHFLVEDLRIETAQCVKGQEALYGAFLWRQVAQVVELKKNMRQSRDSLYADLLNRVRVGKAIPSSHSHHPGFVSDVERIAGRELGILKGQGCDISRFKEAPVIVGSKVIRDAINRVKVTEYAKATRQILFDYCSRDRMSMSDLTGELKQRAWRIRSSLTQDALGRIPMVPGMKVMVTENVAIQSKLVNGTEGTLHSIKYESDKDGNRYLLVAYVRVSGCGLQSPGLPNDVVPILPVRTGFNYGVGFNGRGFYISRYQVPLIPAYCYTDYKSQGRSLDSAIVDLASTRSLQGAYVMLSRVKSLDGLAVLRWFDPKKIDQRLSEEIRDEFDRLSKLESKTMGHTARCSHISDSAHSQRLVERSIRS